MKVWFGYGSEHSMNLVMIGRFKDAGAAKATEQIIGELAKAVADDERYHAIQLPAEDRLYSDSVKALLNAAKIYTIAPEELSQFTFDFQMRRDGTELEITTDESEVSALIKVLLEKEAKVELYSAHDYPDESGQQ